MRTYALKRLLISIPLVFGMTFVVFVIVNWTGATKFDTFENDAAADPQIVELEKRRLGIYDPVPVRYLHWLQGVLFDIRFAKERRYLATFEDNDLEKGDDRYKFGGTDRRMPLLPEAQDYAVGGKTGAAIEPLSTTEKIRSLLDRVKVEWIELSAAAPVPDGLALIVTTASGDVPFAFKPAPDGSASLKVPVDELVRKAALDQIREISLDSAKPGVAKVRIELVKRRVWEETYQGNERKRTIQVDYEGLPGQYAELGQLKSPYTMKSPYSVKSFSGTNWAVDWSLAQRDVDSAWNEEVSKWAKEKVGPKPERPLLAPLNFDTLEFEGRALAGGSLAVEVQLLCGDPKSPGIAKLGEVRLEAESTTFSLPLVPSPPGADLKNVVGLRLVSGGTGRAEFDEFRLRVAGSGFHIGAPEFGQSWDKKKGVISLIGEKVRNTIVMTVLVIVFTWLIALPVGIFGAVRQYSTGDKIVSFLTFIGMAMPSFFLAILLIFLVTLTYEIPKNGAWGWLSGILPVAGRTSQGYTEMSFWAQMRDVAWHLILPSTVGILGGIGGLQRMVRGTMLEERRKNYVVTASAKGLPPVKVLYKHALRNAIIPFVASIGGILPALLGGGAFTEIVFDYPGIGKQMLESVQSYDIPVVMANTLIVGLLLVLGNLLADILLGLVDPRISLES